MNRKKTMHAAARLAFLALLFAAPCLADDEDLRRQASWQPPDAAQLRAELDVWLDARKASDAERERIALLWPTDDELAGGDSLLDRLALAIAAVDDSARGLVQLCSGGSAPLLLPDFPLLDDENRAPLVRSNLRLLYARWLTQHERYDEALRWLDGLDPEDVADPAALLFYQSVVSHRLMKKDACLSSLAKLLENEKTIPRRFRVLARLMAADLAPLRDESLDQVSRLMDDIRRRLSLSRAGTRVRKKEDDVVAILDKMIKEMEEQAQQQQSQKKSNQQTPQQPMSDSRAAGGTGPGAIDPSKIGAKSGWGNLPAKEREQALQQLSKDLPAHYREVIEEYFRKLAGDAGP